MSREPKDKQAPSVYSTDKRLKDALASFLLTDAKGEMGHLIDDLVDLYRNCQAVRFVCPHGSADHSREWVNELLRHWGITIIGIKERSNAPDTVYELKIPNIRDRRPDLPKMIAYYFGDFFGRNTTARSSVTEVSLDLLWYLLGHPNWKDLDAVRATIERSIVAARRGVLTLCQAVVAARSSFQTLIGGLGDACQKRGDPYRDHKALAFLINHPRLVEENVRGECVEWYMNCDRIEARRQDFAPRVPTIPPDRLFQAMSNIYKLSELSKNTSTLPQEELGKIEKCFSLRRQGLTEDRIASQLGMEKRQHRSWTESHSINIEFKRPDRIYQTWTGARDSLLTVHGLDRDLPNTAITRLLIDRDDLQVIVVYGSSKRQYAFKDPGFFEMVLFIAQRMKAGNPAPQKSSIFKAGEIIPEVGKSVSLKTLFKDRGGDPEAFADKFLRSVKGGRWTIDVDVNLIEILPMAVFDDEDDPSDRE